MKATPPIRFLALVLGGWVLARTFVLAPAWLDGAMIAGPPGPPGTAPPPAHAATPMPVIRVMPAMAALQAPMPAGSGSASRGGAAALIRNVSYKNLSVGPLPTRAPGLRGGLPMPGLGGEPARPDSDAAAVPRPAFARSSATAEATPRPAPATAGRWSASAWILARSDRGRPALAPGGTLGGSQAGGRLLYRIDGGLALSGRLYLPLRRPGGAEAAAGLDWQPAPGLPMHLLVERRQALAGQGRSAFAITLYGGGGRDLPRGFRLDAYGQAGVVGLRSRDLFVDGAARFSLAAGPAQVGAGTWAAAQPGAARLDIGPQASIRIPLRGASIRLEADWRFRIAGEAAPGSGPALILAADY